MPLFVCDSCGCVENPVNRVAGMQGEDPQQLTHPGTVTSDFWSRPSGNCPTGDALSAGLAPGTRTGPTAAARPVASPGIPYSPYSAPQNALTRPKFFTVSSRASA